MSKDKEETIDSRIIEEYFKDIDKFDLICTHVKSMEIDHESVKDLENLINLIEIFEECARATRRILQLKQHSYYIKYLAAYV